MKFSRIDKYHINSFDADFTGKLHLPALTRFMQETAWRHSEQLGIGYSDFRFRFRAKTTCPTI